MPVIDRNIFVGSDASPQRLPEAVLPFGVEIECYPGGSEGAGNTPISGADGFNRILDDWCQRNWRGFVSVNDPGFGSVQISERPNRRWRVVGDASLRHNGREYVSPVLPEGGNGNAAMEVFAACEVLAAHRAVVTRQCGLHLHVSIPEWIPRTQRLGFARKLLEAWATIEQRVQRSVAPSRRNSRYCMDVARGLQTNRRNTRWQTSKMYALHTDSIAQAGHVEFRLHHGTTEASKILGWANFCTRFVRIVGELFRNGRFDAPDNNTLNRIVDSLSEELINNQTLYRHRQALQMLARTGEIRMENLPQIGGTWGSESRPCARRMMRVVGRRGVRVRMTRTQATVLERPTPSTLANLSRRARAVVDAMGVDAPMPFSLISSIAASVPHASPTRAMRRLCRLLRANNIDYRVGANYHRIYIPQAGDSRSATATYQLPEIADSTLHTAVDLTANNYGEDTVRWLDERAIAINDRNSRGRAPRARERERMRAAAAAEQDPDTRAPIESRRAARDRLRPIMERTLDRIENPEAFGAALEGLVGEFFNRAADASDDEETRGIGSNLVNDETDIAYDNNARTRRWMRIIGEDEPRAIPPSLYLRPLLGLRDASWRAMYDTWLNEVSQRSD